MSISKSSIIFLVATWSSICLLLNLFVCSSFPFASVSLNFCEVNFLRQRYYMI